MVSPPRLAGPLLPVLAVLLLATAAAAQPLRLPPLPPLPGAGLRGPNLRLPEVNLPDLNRLGRAFDLPDVSLPESLSRLPESLSDSVSESLSSYLSPERTEQISSDFSSLLADNLGLGGGGAPPPPSRGRSRGRPRTPPARCTPFRLPPGVSSLQEHCAALGAQPQSVFDAAFRAAPPATAAEGFPLKGCVVGCVVGTSAAANIGRLPFNAGSWSGKCVDRWDARSGLPSALYNVITLGAAARNWTDGLPGSAAVRRWQPPGPRSLRRPLALCS